METIDHFYAYFNLVFGSIMTLIGFRVYRPFTKEKEEAIYKKFGDFFKYGGIALIVWGLLKIF